MKWFSMTMSLLNQKLFQTTTVLLVFVLHLLYFEASCFDQQPPSALPQEKLTEEKMRLGSRPPSCYNRCSECHPCMAVQVPTIPIQPGMGTMVPLLNKEEYDNTHPSSASKKYTNYKPLGWKCRCGNRLFNP